MAVLMHDEFDGTLGESVYGRTPSPTAFEDIVWSGGGLLDGSGGVGAAGSFGDPPDNFSSTGIDYQFSNVHSNPTITDVECTFVWKTAPSLAIVSEYEIPGLVCSVTLSGARGLVTINATHNAGTGVTSWFLSLLGSADDPVDITADIAADTSYTGTLTVSAGAQSIAFAGHTITATDAATDATGLSLLHITLGGLHKLMDVDLASLDEVFPEAIISTPGPLGAASAVAYHDFTTQMGDAVTRYVMDLTTPGGLVRVPISSWQATLRTGASNYVQCVVPAALDWAASINDATHFTIYRTAKIPDGAAIEYEMARAPLQTASFARGPTNYTVTLSGYSTAFAEDEAPPTSYDRTLTGIRSVTIGSGRTRVRCAIDWLLRPGQRAYYDGESSFVTAFINYYVPQGSDAYMDAGE